jgi:hypothetical protein
MRCKYCSSVIQTSTCGHCGGITYRFSMIDDEESVSDLYDMIEGLILIGHRMHSDEGVYPEFCDTAQEIENFFETLKNE